jgi:nitrile hydratase accessory protein
MALKDTRGVLDVDLSTLPGLPRDDEAPTFNAPWEAQAFAMAVTLHRRGLFTWREWAAALSNELAAAVTRGDPHDGSHYYHSWLATLESLVAAKSVVAEGELDEHVVRWNEAVDKTPHGQPIVPPSVLGRQRDEAAP